MPSERRLSLLNAGGLNSISNFASSYTRAQSFLAIERSPFQDDVSPCTSPDIEASESAIADDESITPQTPHLYNRINTFDFPPDESTSLLRRSSRASSLISGRGESTVQQTIFNSMNILIGIGILSLPFGFRLSGWVLGTIILATCSYITAETAKMLGKILKKYPSLNSYGDIAELTGQEAKIGAKAAHLAVTIIFVIDLFGALVEMVILFGDSLSIVYPNISQPIYKLILITVSFFLSFLLLSALSFLSLLGLICTNCLVVILIICGLISSKSPGSLLVPSTTSLWPENLMNVFMSLGIFMAPWGGHPIFPELYRDMRHPKKYSKSANTSFFLVFDLNYLVAVVGYIMYGTTCEDSITKNLMSIPEYPTWVTPAISLLMATLTITKIPLVSKPVVSVYETYLKLPSTDIVVKHDRRLQNFTLKQIVGRIIFFALLLITSLIFTLFGQVIAFLGSAVVFTMCMTCPLLFYVVLMKDEINRFQAILISGGIVIGLVCSVVGTIASISFVP